MQKRFSFGQVIVGVIWADALLFPLYAFAPSYVFLGVVFALMYPRRACRAG